MLLRDFGTIVRAKCEKQDWKVDMTLEYTAKHVLTERQRPQAKVPSQGPEVLVAQT